MNDWKRKCMEYRNRCGHCNWNTLDIQENISLLNDYKISFYPAKFTLSVFPKEHVTHDKNILSHIKKSREIVKKLLILNGFEDRENFFEHYEIRNVVNRNKKDWINYNGKEHLHILFSFDKNSNIHNEFDTIFETVDGNPNPKCERAKNIFKERMNKNEWLVDKPYENDCYIRESFSLFDERFKEDNSLETLIKSGIKKYVNINNLTYYLFISHNEIIISYGSI